MIQTILMGPLLLTSLALAATVPSKYSAFTVKLDEAQLKNIKSVKWVHSFIETRVIEHADAFDQVEYNHTKLPWLF